MTNTATVSLKGAGKDALWIVLNGTPEEMVEQVKGIFEFPADEIEGLAPVELFINADSTLKAMTTVGTQLGGVAIRDISKKEETGGWHGDAEEQRSTDPQGSAWERAGAADKATPAQSDPEPESAPEKGSQAHPHQDVIDEMKKATSVKELQDVWSKHRDKFKEDPSLNDEYKAIGKALK